MSRFVTTLKTEQTDRRTCALLDDLLLADEDERRIIAPADLITTSPVLKCCTRPSYLCWCAAWREESLYY